MKRSELKKVLKPLIKECIKEVIFDDGVLSGLISEVLKGAAPPPPIAQSAPQKATRKPPQPRATSRKQDSLNEVRKNLTEAIGKEAYGGIDIFEGLEPISKGGTPGASPMSSPLQTYAPSDAGVDISSLVSGKWKNLI